MNYIEMAREIGARIPSASIVEMRTEFAVGRLRMEWAPLARGIA